MGSAVLTALSLSIIAFQMSCSKTANAQTSGTTGLTQQNLVLFVKISENSSGTETNRTVWTSNVDGTNQKQIPINIPWNKLEDARLTPDGKNVIFGVRLDSITNKNALYSCSIDGSNLKKIVDVNSNESYLELYGAY